MDDIRKGLCPLCRHNEILVEATKPLGHRVTRSPQAGAPFLAPTQTSMPYGIVESYICLKCGLIQRFLKDPELMPRDDSMHVLRGPEPQGPYR